MKITKRQLRRIIKEEKARLYEVGPPPDMDAEGWHPNDSQEWERSARFEDEAANRAEKQEFLSAQLARWEDHWDIDDDEQSDIIKDILSDAYDTLFRNLW